MLVDTQKLMDSWGKCDWIHHLILSRDFNYPYKFTRALCWQALYKYRVIFTVDGLIKKWLLTIFRMLRCQIFKTNGKTSLASPTWVAVSTLMVENCLKQFLLNTYTDYRDCSNLKLPSHSFFKKILLIIFNFFLVSALFSGSKLYRKSFTEKHFKIKLKLKFLIWSFNSL